MPFCHMHVMLHACQERKPELKKVEGEARSQQSRKRANKRKRDAEAEAAEAAEDSDSDDRHTKRVKTEVKLEKPEEVKLEK